MRISKKLFFTLGISFYSVTAFTQTQQGITISGQLTGSGQRIEAAAVQLLKARDSTQVQAGFSDKTGRYALVAATPGEYLLCVEALGYRKYYSARFATGHRPTVPMPLIVLESTVRELNGVVVTSKKPFIEQRLDKTIVNIEASPTNAGLSALDVLEKSPGITLDKDGNISLKGKNGVLVLMDGKPTYLSGADLVNVLKNMSSSNLDQIEIMTNPPAKYDAAGNAGIINIRTKKTRIKGFNGSVNIGGGMGRLPKTNNSLNLNYRAGKFNLFGNYSHSWNKGFQNLALSRNFRDQQTGEVLSVFKQLTHFDRNFQTHSFKAGADYALSPQTTLGMVVNGFFNPGTSNNTNTTNILQPGGQLDSIIRANNTDKSRFNNLGANLNFRQVFDTIGTELTADLDYLRYRSSKDQQFQNIFYNSANTKVRPDELIRGSIPSDIDIYSGKVDWIHPLKGSAKLEAGGKFSAVQTSNDARYTNRNNSTGDWETDRNRSNNFVYKEQIYAGYLNLTKQLDQKWSGQLGVRVENTHSRGNQLTTGQTFERNYTQWFPTVFIGYNPNSKNQLGLNYGRRIERPDYEDMNPFYYFLDKYTYQVGNPYLRPQFSHNIELTHTYGGFLTSSIGYSSTNDIIMDVLEQVDSTRTSFQTKKNIARTTSYTASISANLPITKWWRTNIYLQANNRQFSGVINTGYIRTSGTGVVANISNQFTLKKGWGMELSGFYRGRTVEGVLVSKPMGALSFAVSKQVLHQKGTIRLNVRDFLDLQSFRGYSRYQNVDIAIHNQWDNRVVNLSFTYRFSKGKVDNLQRKRGSANEEQNRVKGAGSN